MPRRRFRTGSTGRIDRIGILPRSGHFTSARSGGRRDGLASAPPGEAVQHVRRDRAWWRRRGVATRRVGEHEPESRRVFYRLRILLSNILDFFVGIVFEK